MKTPSSNRTSILKGGIFTIVMRWLDRLIGFTSTLILARLLVPEDFGIIAMASLVVGLLDVLLDLGVHVALIRNRDATQAHYNTAWTIRLVQMTIIASVIVVCAPLAGSYFSDQRVVPVLRTMSAGLIFIGLENIGVVNFQKNMQFGLDFRYTLLKRVAGFIVTITAAWLTRSYWALVMGTLSGRAFGVFLSYRMHPMRPRFSFEKFGEIFSVSQWLLVRSIGGYLDNNLHKILVGQRSGTATMGTYSLADEVSSMPSTELLAPLNRVLLPAFVNAAGDHAELKRLFLLAQGVQTIVAIPAAVGLAMVAHEAVFFLLGQKWLAAVPFIQWLPLALAIDAITTSSNQVMITLGRVRNVALLVWIRVVLFVTGVFLILPNAGAFEIAKLRVLTVFFTLVLTLWLMMRTLTNVRPNEIVATITRPLIGAIAMAGALYFAFATNTLPILPTLVLKIATGIVIYPMTVLLLWRLFGKPPGAESYLIEKMGIMARSVKNRFS